MIKKVKIEGFRGKNLEVDFSGAMTIVVGANTAGKTSLADAIRWGLLGYIPGMDKPPRGWAELIGNGESEASVELTLKKGSVQRKVWLENGSPKVKSLAEAWPETNVLCLNPSEFLESPGPRQATLVAEATSSSFDWKALVPAQFGKLDHAKSWQWWLASELEAAKQNRSDVAVNKKTLTATVRGLEYLRGIVIEDDVAMKAKVDEGKERLGSLKEQLRAVTIQIANVKDQPSPQQKLDALRRALQDFVGMNHDAETYAERVKDCEARYNERMSRPGPAWDIDQLRIDMQSATGGVAGDKARLDHLSELAKKLKAKYKDLKKAKRCPTCGTEGDNLAEALKLAENAETRQLAGEAEQALKDLEKSEAEKAATSKRLELAEEYQNKGVALEEERLKLMDEGRLIDLWKEHDEMVATASEQTQLYDVQGLESRAYDIRCELEEEEENNQSAERELSAIGYKRSQRKQLDEVEQELKKAEDGWETWNKKVHDLEELRDRFTAMSVGSILGVLEKFTKGIFKEPLSLQGTELGRMIGSRWVPLSQFSGSEQAVAVAALTCALRGDPTAKNVVLADELSSFDDAHLSLFLGNVHQAIKEGVLDQFIGFTTPRKSTASMAKHVNSLHTVTI